MRFNRLNIEDDLNSMDSDSMDGDSVVDSHASPDDEAELHLNLYKLQFPHHFLDSRLDRSNTSGTTTANNNNNNNSQTSDAKHKNILSLLEMSAKIIAHHIPFGQVEKFKEPVPETLQLRIAFWSFPQDEEDIRLYSCLSNGGSQVFTFAESLVDANQVHEVLQVGFHLSAVISCLLEKLTLKVSITFDRRKITHCFCSCTSSSMYCAHVVALCLHRIRRPNEITLRVPLSESMQKLDREQLQKFALYFISDLHNNRQPTISTAQKYIDELLSNDTQNSINKEPAAPDPTAGATPLDEANWCLDVSQFYSDIQKLMKRHSKPRKTVVSDPQSLNLIHPQVSLEFTQLLRTICSKEPEGLWNLVLIVGEMIRRRDANSFSLLDILTQKILNDDKMVIWWFETKISLYSGTVFNAKTKISREKSKTLTYLSSQYSSSNFCDQVVHLWRLIALNPVLSSQERQDLENKFFDWHLKILKRFENYDNKNPSISRNMYLFSGFKPAIEGCQIKWDQWDNKNQRIIDLSESKEDQQVEKAKAPKKKRRGKNKSKSQQQQQKVATLDENENIDPQILEPLVEEENNNHQQQDQEQQIEEDLDVELNFNNDDLDVYFIPAAQETPPKSPLAPEKVEDLIRINPKRIQDPLEAFYSRTEGLYAHGYIEESEKAAVRVAYAMLDDPSFAITKCTHFVNRKRKKRPNRDNFYSVVTSESLQQILFICNILIQKPCFQHLVFRLALFGLELKRSPASTKLLEVKLYSQKEELVRLLKSLNLQPEDMDLLRAKSQALVGGEYQNHDALTILQLGSYIFQVLVLSEDQTANCSNDTSTDNSFNSDTSTDSDINNSNNSNNSNNDLNRNNNDTNSSSDVHNSNTNNNDPNYSNHVALERKSCGTSISNHNSKAACFAVQSGDQHKGFKSAIYALSFKTTVAENVHPLLCEATRRQRGALAIEMLSYYRDEPSCLNTILEALIEKDVILSAHSNGESTRSSMAMPSESNNINFSNANASASASSESSCTPTIATKSSNFCKSYGVPPLSKKSFPNSTETQPTEVASYFMFELAKTLFDKAGGDSRTAHMFRPQVNLQNPHRNLIHSDLHMCTLKIAIYSLKLWNRQLGSWKQRTYSTTAQFICEQAAEIGLPAIEYISEHWEDSLSAAEALSLADKASELATRINDQKLRLVAAKLAKSCLKYASVLESTTVATIFNLCRKQNVEMLIEACNDVETVADYESVGSDVLFEVARTWTKLFDSIIQTRCMNDCCETSRNQTPSVYFGYPPPNFPRSIINPVDLNSASAIVDSTGSSIWPGNHSSTDQANINYNNHTNAPGSLNIGNESISQYPWYSNCMMRPAAQPFCVVCFYRHLDYVKNAFRNGIKAIKSVKPPASPLSKQHTVKEEDLCWLLGLSKFLGRNDLRVFVFACIRHIANTDYLYSLADELVKWYLQSPSQNQEFNMDWSEIVLPFIHECLDKLGRHTRELFKHNTNSNTNMNTSLEGKNQITKMIVRAQHLTEMSGSPVAAGILKEMLNFIDMKKSKIKALIDTRQAHELANRILKHSYSKYSSS